METIQDSKIPSIPHLNKWTGNASIGAYYSEYPPAFATMNDILYAVYTGTSGNLWMIQSADGVNWTNNTEISAGGSTLQSDQPPSLTVMNGHMYVAFKQKGEDEMYMANFDGSSWTTKSQIDTDDSTPKTDAGPAICYYPTTGKIYCAYQGKSAKMYIVEYSGGTWSNNDNMEDTDGNKLKCDSWPALALYNGNLVCCYQGNGSHDIFYAEWDGSGNFNDSWAPNSSISIPRGIKGTPKTDSGISLTPFNGKLWMFYKGKGTDYVYEAVLNNQTWGFNLKVASLSTLDVQSPVSPGAGSFTPAGSKTEVLSLLYPADDGTNNIWGSTYS